MSIENIRRIKEETKIIKPKKISYIPKVSEKRKKQLAEQKESGTDNGHDKFYEEMRKLIYTLTGVNDRILILKKLKFQGQ